jgi:1-hydroxycarotenoid 3,4-desaturase
VAERQVVIVGAGMAGLAAALDLAGQGVRVTLLEKDAQVGGKNHQKVVAGQAMDSGPTVITMRWVFEDLLAAAGLRLEDFVELKALPIIARHAWSEHEWLDLFADKAASVDAIARFSGPDEARRFQVFSQEARRVYQALEAAYIRAERPTITSMSQDLGFRGLGLLAGLGPFASLWKSLGRYFHDPRLRQLFARYATYCGGSPWQAPATLMLIAYVEQRGVWAARGGIKALAQGLGKAAEQLGVELRCNALVQEILIEHGRTKGVLLADGQSLFADAVIFNGEAAALHQGLLGDSARAALPITDGLYPRSLSALTFSMIARTQGKPLDFHNVVFQKTPYDDEFNTVFGQGRLPTRPTVYICAHDRGPFGYDPTSKSGPLESEGHAPSASTIASTASETGSHERLFMLVNAPARADHQTLLEEEISACQKRVLAQLQQVGLTLAPQAMQVGRPQDFHRMFPASAGALYGMAPHGWMSSFQRPTNRTPLPGLFLAGGSVHPGAGVPMASLSGRLAAAALMAHLDSTRKSQRVVISGGMSMD